MDKKLGYYKEIGYSDEIIRNIINDVSEKKIEGTEYDNLVFKVEELLSRLKEEVFNVANCNIGISDRQSSYKMIFHKLFSEEMNKNKIDFETKKNNDNKYISKLIIKVGNNRTEYVYNDEKGEYWFTKEETETIIGDEKIER